MLRWRLPLGTLFVAALVGLGWLDATASLPGVWLMPVAVLIALLAGQETVDLLDRGQALLPAWPVHLGNALVLVAAWLPALWGRPTAPYEWAALMSAVWLVFLVAMRRYQAPGRNADAIARAVFSVVYVGGLLSFAVALRMEFGIGALAGLVVVVKMGDIGAYTVGSLIGRHKMAPKISPGKTLEGAAGALAFATLGAWGSFALMAALGALPSGAALPAGGWIPFGLVVGLAGILGDLAESLLKRDAGVKDSSRWLPGFGGVLDILDSILLAAPVAWFFWKFELFGL